MIPPQELKNKSFTRTAKGYDIAEVDGYIDFIIEKYSELFAQCDKYDKKLRIVSSRISEIQQEEDTIQKLSITTQKNCDRLLAEAEREAKNKIEEAEKTAEQILSDARERAQTALFAIEKKSVMQIDATQKKSDALLLSARTRCTKLLADFKKEIALQRENILNIKNISEEFNSKLLAMYKNHLNILSENTYTPSIDLDSFTESKLFDSVMKEIKNDAAEIARKNSAVEYDFEKELNMIKDSKNSLDNYEVKTKSGNAKHTQAGDAEDIENTDNYDNKDDNVYNDGGDTENNTDKDDEDVKVFAKNNADNSQTQNNGSGFDLRFLPDSDEENMYEEKPMATYDSDDYEYSDGGGDNNEDEEYYDDGYNEDDDNYNENYSDLDGDGDLSGEEYDDISEETQKKSESKGFFGLFKNKKKKKKEEPADYPEDDYNEDEDREDEVMDIFEDLNDKEE